MSKQVKIGIVGTSWWADAMYMPELTRHSDADLRAVVGRNIDHARACAEQWGVRHVYTSLEELPANDSVDAVIIASSKKHHYQMAMNYTDVDNTPVEPSFRDGARIQRYREAALLSVWEGRRVQVNEIQPEE